MARSHYRTVMDHPADRVWEVARDFNGLATWFAGSVMSSEIEEGRRADSVGCVRNFLFGETRIRERLLAISDIDRWYAYEFGEPKPFPVLDYVATLRVTPITDGDRALVEWWTDFDCDTADLARWTGYVAASVFAPALDSLRAHLAA